MPNHVQAACSTVETCHCTVDPALHLLAVEHLMANQGRACQNLRRSREPEISGGPEGCRCRSRGRGDHRRLHRFWPGPPGRCAAAGGSGIVLCHFLLAVQQVLSPQPLVVRRRVPPPLYQVGHDATDLPPVEQQLDLVLADKVL
jgi:hypothetical protein